MNIKDVPNRENLLITMGVRAGSMDKLGHIHLPRGIGCEDKLAAFVRETVTNYLQTGDDVSFDKYIEAALTKKYPKVKTCCYCRNWQPRGLSHGVAIGYCKIRGTIEAGDTTACENLS